MIHDEHHGGLRIDRIDRLFILIAEAHVIESIAQQPGQTDGETEIGKGGKGRHDLARIATGGFRCHRLGHALFLRVFLYRLADLRIIDQPLDHVVTPRQLEGLDRTLQPLVQPRHRAFQPSAKEPPHRWEQKMRGKCDRSKDHDQHKQPKRKFHGLRHRGTVPPNATTHNR